EMVEGDDRGDPAPRERGEHLVVVRDRAGVDLPTLRLDPAPFDREAVRAVAVGLSELEVAIEELVVPACRAAPVPGGAALVLPSPPIVPAVLALDLVGRGRGAPPEAG